MSVKRKGVGPRDGIALRQSAVGANGLTISPKPFPLWEEKKIPTPLAIALSEGPAYQFLQGIVFIVSSQSIGAQVARGGEDWKSLSIPAEISLVRYWKRIRKRDHSLFPESLAITNKLHCLIPSQTLPPHPPRFTCYVFHGFH